MSRFLKERLVSLEAYVPGEQPKDKKYIKLNTNESPYPPSPAVLDAINCSETEKLNLYPDPTCSNLRRKLGERYGVKASEVFVSNGSDDILNFAFMAFCGGEKGMAFPDITYGFYKVFGLLHGVKTEVIPLGDDFSVDVDAFCKTEMNVVIANPNAPTGIALPLSDIERILSARDDRLVIVDEAYVDFGGESALSLLPRYDNLLVVRTFSKSRSMAGARLGFAFGREDVIADLEKLKYSTNPYDINRLTQTAGAAAIDSDGYYFENAERIIKTREKTAEALISMGFQVVPSKANFLFARHPRYRGEALYSSLRDRGILVRHFGGERIKEYLRITVGSEAEMEAFLSTVADIIKN